jgi:large subunit ribosomal protein L44
MLQRGQNAVRISSSILREWRRRTIYRVPARVSSPWHLNPTFLVSSRSLIVSESHSDGQISAGEGQGANATAKSPEMWNIDPLTGKKRVGSNWNYSSELSALAHRVGIDPVHLPLLQVALRDGIEPDGSQLNSLEEQQYEEDGHLSVRGRSVMLHYVHEYLYFNYPKLKTAMLHDIREFLNSDPVVTNLASHLGITQLIQTTKILGDPSNASVIRTAFYAVIGLLYENQGGKAARSFVHDFIISQLASNEVGELITLQQPRFILHAVLKSKGRRRPVSRLIKESGRATHFPSFVVGVYSGAELLGEGCGTSLKRAEREAMLAALRTHFQTELSNVILPSDDQEMIPEEELLQWTSAEGQHEVDNHQSNEHKIKATI